MNLQIRYRGIMRDTPSKRPLIVPLTNTHFQNSLGVTFMLKAIETRFSAPKNTRRCLEVMKVLDLRLTTTPISENVD